jgi:hypothetical protein
MVVTDATIGGTKCCAAGGAVGDEQTVEWVTSPLQPESVADKASQRDVIDGKACIAHHSIHKFRITNSKTSNFGEKLDFQKRHWRYTPRTVPVDPGKFRDSFRSQNKPDQEVRIKEKCQRAARRRETRPPSGPRHSHDHRSARSASDTRRSFLYRRVSEPFPFSFDSSRRSTSRRPLRWTTITSPPRASSRRRNQCFLASEALTFFICTMYKTPMKKVKTVIAVQRIANLRDLSKREYSCQNSGR